MPMTTPQEASPNQRERLWQIDFLLRFRGQVTRQDLVQRFAIALSNATRDLTLYRQLAPQNLDYDHSDKVYRRTESFKPLFAYDREHTLQTLSLGQGLGSSLAARRSRLITSPLLISRIWISWLRCPARFMLARPCASATSRSVVGGAVVR